MATPPDELYRQFELELAKFTDRRTAEFMALLESARRDLQGVLAEPDSYTANRVTALIGEIDTIASNLRREINSVGPSSEHLAKMAARHTGEVATIITGHNIALDAGALNVDLLRRFSLNELEHVTRLVESEVQAIKAVLFTKVGVKGENPSQVARKLAGKDGMFAGRFGHVETIMRTETSTVYNAHATDSIIQTNAEYGLALNNRIVETIDLVRNHPISLLLNGMIQTPGQEFRVSVAAVKAKAASLKKSAGGVFWPIKNGFYHGKRLPAHYRERGIIVATESPPNVQ